MADGKTRERTTSGSRLPLEVESASRLVDDTETDVEIFSQRAVTEAAYFDRDFGENDADNCPNFSIYSATSIDFTKDIDADAKITPPESNADPYDEGDENLVQMTDDEFEDDIKSPEELIRPADNESFDKDTFDEKDFFENKDAFNDKEASPVKAQSEEREDVDSTTPDNNAVAAEHCAVEKQDVQNQTKAHNSSAENVIAEADSQTECNKSVEQPAAAPVKTKAAVKKPKFPSLIPNKKVFLELYDDSDWEEWTNEKTDEDKSVGNSKPSKISDIEKLTESISDVEDERGYTPCQDELVKARNLSDDDQEVLNSIGIGGLDTELISEDEGNIFADDIPRNKLRAVESNIEDGEIIEKNKNAESAKESIDLGDLHKENKRKSKDKDKENQNSKSVLTEPFKKISAKDRNYRDKDRRIRNSRSRSLPKRYNYRKKKDHSNRKKEKRKDLEWYDVRNMITEKNKRRSDKDEYGRERRPSLSKSRSRDRLRSKSRGRSRRRRDSERRNRSRGRSGYGRFHNSRSKSRSITRSRSVSVERPPRKRKSHSTRRRTRSPSKDRYSNVKTVAPPRSKSKSPVRKIKKAKRKRSTSYQRDWTPSWSSPNNSPLSESPPNPPSKRMPSPSWTPPLRENMSNAQNLTVIVSNKDANKKKKEKRKKTDSKLKESGAAVKAAKKRRREDQQMPMDQPSKEVFASGDNILVSVSFNKNKTTAENPPVTPQKPEQTVTSKRKNKTQEPEQRKRRNSKSKDKTVKTNARRNRYLDLANRKPIAIIDLDKSPFKELTPSPRAIIVLTDSDSEEKDQNSREERMHEEPNARKETRIDNLSSYNPPSTFTNNTGPKTPPEPQINFSLQLKTTPKLRNLNLLYDQEDENENDDLEQSHGNMASDHIDDGPHKGPNTPPEPPNSPPSSPDAYDPFEPTKSASQSPNAQDTSPEAPGLPVDKTPVSEEKTDTTAMVTQVPPPEDKPMEVGLGTNTVEKVLALLTQRFNSTPEKHLMTSIPQNDTGKIQSMDSEQKSQNAPTENNKVPSPDASKGGVTILSNVLLQPNMLSGVLKCTTSESGLVYTSGAPVSSTPMIATLNASRASLFNSANNNMQNMTATSSNKNSKLQTRPSPIKSNPIKPMVKTAVIKPGIRPYMVNKVNKPSKHDTDADIESPYSPGSDDFDDLFEPPPTDAASKPASKNQKASKSPAKKSSHNDFDHLFMSPSYKPSISSKSEKRFYSKKYRRAATKANKTQVGVKIDDDQLKVLEELPSSAVEMQVKDKFMKKLNRQERVVEEVKVVLKPHYAKKHISKEQYKDILRRAVPKICHNRSGEINPQRIHKLIEAYVKKARYSRKTNA